jgi:hypothetical protein
MKTTGVGPLDQPTEPRLPILASGDVVLVEVRLEAGNLQPGQEVLREVFVFARVGNEDLELAIPRRAHVNIPQNTFEVSTCRPNGGTLNDHYSSPSASGPTRPYRFSKNSPRHRLSALHSDVLTFTQPLRVPDR